MMMSKRSLHASGDPPRWTVREHRFALLLCALAVLLIGAPLVQESRSEMPTKLADMVFPILFAAMLLSAVFAVSRTRATKVIALLLAIPATLLQGLEVWVATDGFGIAGNLLGILFLGYAVVLILKFVFMSPRITTDMICASLCVYLLLGFLYALVYSLLLYRDPTSFVFALGGNGEDDAMPLGVERTIITIYYSLVTMSTLGYGDIVPTTLLARTCAALQAVVGQIYLAVLVARLVGLHIVHSAATSVTEPREPATNESRTR